MAKLEVFQNGNFSSGEPVYQIGSKYKDGEYGEYGEYDIVVFDPMTKSQAEKKLAEMQPAAAAPKKKAAKLKIPSKVELELLTKAELPRQPLSAICRSLLRRQKTGYSSPYSFQTLRKTLLAPRRAEALT